MVASQSGITFIGNMALLVNIKGIVRKFITAVKTSMVFILEAIAMESPAMVKLKHAERRIMAIIPGIPVANSTPKRDTAGI